MNRSQEIVLFLLQHTVAIGHARRHQFHHATFHQLLGQFGVFKLFAHCHLQSGTHQLRQIGVQSMMREASQFNGIGNGTRPFGEHNPQNLGGFHGILAIRFIKIAHAKQQHGIGVFRLEGEILLHQRGFGRFFCHKNLGLRGTKLPFCLKQLTCLSKFFRLLDRAMSFFAYFADKS